MQWLSGILSVLLTLLLPIGAALWLCIRQRRLLKPILLGALTFFVFQLVLRIPLLTYILPGMEWFLVLQYRGGLPYALFLGVSAALFEEFGRFLTLFFMMHTNPNLRDGVAFGVGYGGLESISLVGISVLALLVTGQPYAPAELLLGSVERVFALCFQIAMSVLVLRAVHTKKYGWVFLAFFLHMILDTGAAWMIQLKVSVYVVELILAGVALFSIGYVWVVRRKMEVVNG